MLKDTVRQYVQDHRSGAIEVHFISEGNGRSVSYNSLDAFASEYLDDGAIASWRESSAVDVLLDRDNGIIHPLTERGWTKLEELHAEFGDGRYPYTGYYFKVDGVDASFARVRFRGLLDVVHDQDRIRRDQRQNEIARRDAGYGTSRMGGWVES